MKKTFFRKNSVLAKATAAVLSVTLAFGMTPAVALAQPAAEQNGGIAVLSDSDVASVKALISALPTAQQVTAAAKGTYDSQIKAAVDAYNALDAADQKTLDDTTVEGGSHSYGRALENAEWALAAVADCDNSTTLADNTYTETTTPAISSEYSKGKSTSSRDRPWSITDVTVTNGKAYGTVTVESKTYTYIYMGGVKIENSAPSGSNSVFKNVPIDLNSTQYISAYSSSMETEIVFSLTNTIDESSGTVAPVVVEIPAENITNTTGMFKIVAAQIETANGKSNLRFTLSGSGVVELFRGTYEECVANGDGTADKGNNTWIHGTTEVTLSEGKVEFVMPIDEGENDYAVTSISNSHYKKYLAGSEPLSRCMYPRHIKVNTDEQTLEAGDYTAVRDLAVTVTGTTPAITAASLETIGGPNSNGYAEDLTLTTEALAAYLGTAADAATATEGVVEAANGSLTIALTGNNYGGSGTSFTGVVPLALKGADGTWVDTTATIDKTAKTITVAGPAASAAKATVSYSVQAAGAYLAAPANDVEVSGDLAESYGYKDSIEPSEGVSAADVMVAAALDVFGEEGFTADTAKTLLNWSDSGFVNVFFGTTTYANGFLVNHAIPNDGTEASSGGYNGTTITTTKVNNGDLVEFFKYEDESYYLDKYTYLDVPTQAFAGTAFDVTVTGVSAMGGYLYKDAAAMKAAATALEGVSLGIMNVETGAVTPVEGTTTDANGKATLTFNEGGDYYLVAYGTDTTEAPVIMSPAKISVLGGTYNVTASINKDSDHTPFAMCKVSDAALFIENGAMTLRFKTSSASYKGIFMGAYADATLDKTIMGEKTSDGYYQFEVPVTADMLTAPTTVTLLKKDGKTFYSSKKYALELSITNMVKQEGASPAAQAVIDTIAQLPETITYDDGATIRAARAGYDALMDFRKAEVTNYDKLVAAETVYNQMPIVWPALPSSYDTMNGNNFTDDPYYMVAYNDNRSNIFVRLYVDSRNYNRAFAMSADKVTADTTGGTLTAVTDSDAGYVQFSAQEVQLGKTYTYTLAKIENGELKATKEISFTLPSFRGYEAFGAGTYNMMLQSDYEALDGISAVVTSDGSAMSASVTPKTPIAKAYVGTAEAAAAATEGFIEPNEQGVLTLPIAQADIPTSIAVFDGTKWTDQRIQIVADEATQNVIKAIQNIYRDGVDENGKALTRSAYWDIYPADREAVEAANAAYQALTDDQKAVVALSNASELLHAVAMFKAADNVSAEIATLPESADDLKTSDDVNAVKAVQEYYESCGSGIFDWYPDGQAQGIQARYVQKLVPSADKEKLATLYAAAQDKSTLSLDASATTVKPGHTVTVDIVATSPAALSCAQFKIAASENLKLVSITQGSGLALTAGEGAAAGSFEATVDNGVVSFYGNTADATAGIVVATATFEGVSEGEATVSVSDAVFGSSGSTLDNENILLPAAANISVASYDFEISATSYVEASGIKLVTFKSEVPEGKVPTMKGAAMYKLGNSFVALAKADEAAALTRDDFDVVDGSAQVVSADGDVNMNGKVNIVDAQLAYDIANSVYTDFSAVSMEGYLKADVNNDSSVDAADAFAIQRFALLGTFNEA